jgi:hypothetical protein
MTPARCMCPPVLRPVLAVSIILTVCLAMQDTAELGVYHVPLTAVSASPPGVSTKPAQVAALEISAH